MSQPDIRRYRQELKRSVRGRRLRKQLADAFDGSLAPLLEDIPSPTYEDLTEAFGPPKHLTETLLHNINVYPISRKTCIGAAISIITLVCIIVYVIFSLCNIPEKDTQLLDSIPYTGQINMHMRSFVDDPFTYGDSHWNQPRNMTAYQVEVYNTNNVTTYVHIRYSDHQPAHTFEVPAKDAKAFVVNDSRPGEHSISYDTKNGSLSGTVKVLVSDEPIT